MDCQTFSQLPWSESKAYMLGLFFPRLDIGKTDNGNTYALLGTVAHNSGTVNEEDLLQHVLEITDMFVKDGEINNQIEIKMSNDVRYLTKKTGKFRKNGKKGFAICLDTLIPIDENQDIDQLEDQLNDYLIDVLEDMPTQFVKPFVIGTIDGRSTYDTTYGLVATDIDRNDEKQVLLEKLTNQLPGISSQINRRGGRSDEEKSDQLRYLKESIQNIVNLNIKSAKRQRDLKQALVSQR